MDDPGKDVVAQDGSHRVEHTTEQKHWATRAAEREGAPQQVNPERNQSWADSTQQGQDERRSTVRRTSEIPVGLGNSATKTSRQPLAQEEEMPAHSMSSRTTELPVGAGNPATRTSSPRLANDRTLREKLSPYGQRLKEDVTSSIRNAPQRAKETVVRAGRNTVQYADQRTDSMMDSFAFDPLGQIQQGRQIRQHQKEKLIMIREQQAEGTRAVPTPRHPRRELAQSGLNLRNEDFAPAPTMGFDAIRGGRATGRKRKRDVGPGDLLL